VPQYELTPEQKPFTAVNARLARMYPQATGPIDPLPDADEWALEMDKAGLLE
jgi:ferredoxin